METVRQLCIPGLIRLGSSRNAGALLVRLTGGFLVDYKTYLIGATGMWVHSGWDTPDPSHELFPDGGAFGHMEVTSALDDLRDSACAMAAGTREFLHAWWVHSYPAGSGHRDSGAAADFRPSNDSLAAATSHSGWKTRSSKYPAPLRSAQRSNEGEKV
jgi:hypothetical protein